MPANAWTRDEIAAIGRPLNRFDVCPHCGAMAREHYADVVSGNLKCPSIGPAETYAEWRARIEKEERQEMEDRRARKGLETGVRNRIRQQLREEQREQEAAEGRLETGQPRRYFDEG